MSTRAKSPKFITEVAKVSAQVESPKPFTNLFVDPNTGRIFDSLRPLVRFIAENSEELNSK